MAVSAVTERFPFTIWLMRILQAQGEPGAAFGLLEQQRVQTELGRRNGRLIEILSLQALALQAEERLEGGWLGLD